MHHHPNYRLRRPRIPQNSPFLRLPHEIRSMIYKECLVAPRPMDLWPRAFACSPDQYIALEPHLQHWYRPIPTSNTRIYDKCWWFTETRTEFRVQEDLAYIRKELCVGLLRTCVQVYHEAAGYFWRDNVWRFSDDKNWEGVLRFLLTIGPSPRAWIRKLYILAPFVELQERHSDGWTFDKVRIKNEPKTQMAKVWKGQGSRIATVLDILRQDQTLEEVSLIVPFGYQVAREVDVSDWPLDLDFVKTTVVVEDGGRVTNLNHLMSILKQGWSVIGEKGSRIKKSRKLGSFVKTDLMIKSRTWTADPDPLDYLTGIPRLFEGDAVISVHARGGRAHVKNSRRALKAYGPCVINEIRGPRLFDCNGRRRCSRCSW